jgi:NADPH2:quinone reductase
VKPAETVLVHGATGGAGTAAVQLARAAGLKIIGTAGTSEGLDFIRAQGAEHAINHRDPDHWDQVMEITNGAGVDVVLEMLANVNLAQDLKIVGREGRIVVIGSRGTVEIDPRDAMVKEATILGVLLFNASETELATIHRVLGERLAAGKLCPEIGQTFPLKDASLAHEAVLHSHAFGKIALIP